MELVIRSVGVYASLTHFYRITTSAPIREIYSESHVYPDLHVGGLRVIIYVSQLHPVEPGVTSLLGVNSPNNISTMRIPATCLRLSISLKLQSLGNFPGVWKEVKPCMPANVVNYEGNNSSLEIRGLIYKMFEVTMSEVANFPNRDK